MAENDADLVQRCLAGDESAKCVLVERFQGPVFGLCFRMLCQREDAEDIAQEVFLRAFRSLHRWDPSRPLKPWLLAIAANRCRTAFERRSREPLTTEFVESVAADSKDSEGADLAEELQAVLQKLREDYRLCFTLFYQQELSCAEIGKMIGRPQGTVKTWLHRARRELAEHLTRRLNAAHPLTVQQSASD